MTLDEAAESFPRQSARTQRYTLGEPRNVVVSPDGQRIVFLRSRGGTDPVNCLWVVDAATGDERLVADPADLLAGRGDAAATDDLPAEERLRRERAREAAGGITAFATDDAVTVAAFALAGRLFVAGLSAPRRASSPSPARCSTRGPTRSPSASPTSAVGCSASASSTAAGTSSPAATTTSRTRSRGAAPTSSPPRRCTGSAGSGGAPTAPRSPSPGSTPHRSRRWWVADAADPGSGADRGRLPGRRHRQRRRHPARRTTRRDDRSRCAGIVTSCPYLADVQWSEHGLIIVVQRRDQTGGRRARRRPGDGRHHRALRATSTTPGSSWCPACRASVR